MNIKTAEQLEALSQPELDAYIRNIEAEIETCEEYKSRRQLRFDYKIALDELEKREQALRI